MHAAVQRKVIQRQQRSHHCGRRLSVARSICTAHAHSHRHITTTKTNWYRPYVYLPMHPACHSTAAERC